ncbi:MULTISPECIES: ABC transporter permease [Streptomyces]|uniref:ABC transporter permease n=1 Tax=Streptomyces TaxID=1883 RepID=UPI00030EAB47|nr:MULTISPECIES: ABC transporter permease [Streptomyces]MBP5868965.1 ABC transporter permease [Streptomyces sp. LBUM 1485]MBP5907475.1 ABC transporter permease [Streptomyces sp. LBUM 1478]MBP5929642.1 ABC transporter permease [Streptomyces sp. LBUM 1479]KFG02986.1 hypothetical protein IQ61_43430 [Streptomyces scabiei]MBP5915111.1 ABC transporter permease [Streptomyces sp. LBUM 1486]
MFSLVVHSCRSRLGQYAGSLIVVVMASALFTALATIVDRVQLAGLGHGPERSAESLMGLVGGTSGLAALLLVGNTLSLVVQQRRREIGVLRTIGASPAQIRAEIVAETLVIALVGGVAGAVAGGVAAGPALRWLIAHQVFPPGPEAGFSPQGFAIGVLGVVAVAVLAALAAVYRPTRTLRSPVCARRRSSGASCRSDARSRRCSPWPSRGRSGSGTRRSPARARPSTAPWPCACSCSCPPGCSLRCWCARWSSRARCRGACCPGTPGNWPP